MLFHCQTQFRRFSPSATFLHSALACTVVAGIAISTVGLTGAPAHAQQVVINGGFENNAGVQAPPWAFGGNAFAYNSDGAFANTGQSSAIIGGVALFGSPTGVPTFNGSASQALNINRAGLYQLTYYITATRLFPTATTYTVTSSVNGKVARQDTFTPSLPAGAQYPPIQEATQVKIKRRTANLSFQAIANNSDAAPSFVSLDDVSLTFLRGLTIDFRRLAVNQNERDVANALYAATKLSSGQQGPVFNALSKVSNAAAPAVLDSLSGEGIAASQNIAFRAAQLFNSAIFDQTTFYGTGGAANSVTLTAPVPGFTALANSNQTMPEQTLAAASAGKPVRELADLPSAKVEPAMPAAVQRTWRAWGTGFGGIENIGGNRTLGSARQENSIIGGALGVDYQLLPNYLVGVAVGGTDGTFQVRNRGTSGSTDGGHIAIYDIATFGKFYGASSSSFSYYGNRTMRFTGAFGGLASEQERGNFDSHEFRTRLEFGRHFDGTFGLGTLGAVTPFLALEIADLRSNGFTESSVNGPGLLRLNVSGQSIASASGFVGARLQRVTPLGNGMVFSPTLQVAYVHEFAPYRNQTGQIANLPGSVFLVDGARPARDAAQVKAGGDLSIGRQAAIFANFDGEFSGIAQLYAGKGGFKYLW